MFFVLRSSEVSGSGFVHALDYLYENYFSPCPQSLPQPDTVDLPSTSLTETTQTAPEPLRAQRRPRPPIRHHAITARSFLDLSEIWSWILREHNRENTPTYDWDTILVVDSEDWESEGFGMLNVRGDLTGFRGVGRMWIPRRKRSQAERVERVDGVGGDGGREEKQTRYRVVDCGDTTYTAPQFTTKMRNRETEG